VNSRLRNILVVGASVLVLAWIFTSGSGDDKAIEDELYSSYRRLAKYRSIAEDTMGMEAGADELEGEVERYEKRLLRGESPALGSAELQRVVSDIASGSGLRLQAVKPLPMIENGDYLEVPLQFDLKGGIGAFRRFVDFLEKEKRGLRVSKLTISVANVREPGDLNIKMAVHGLMKL